MLRPSVVHGLAARPAATSVPAPAVSSLRTTARPLRVAHQLHANKGTAADTAEEDILLSLAPYTDGEPVPQTSDGGSTARAVAPEHADTEDAQPVSSNGAAIAAGEEESSHAEGEEQADEEGVDFVDAFFGEIEPPAPLSHPSARDLADLNSLVSMQYMTSSHLCTNCTTPRTSGQDVCSYCGHDSRNDAALLGPPLAMTAGAALSIPGLDPLALAAWEDPSSSSSALMGGMGAEGQRSPSPVRVPMVATAKLDERMLLHRPSLTPHPERPERLRAIVNRLSSAGLMQQFKELPAREATDEELLAVHSPELVHAITASSAAATVPDPDAPAAASLSGVGSTTDAEFTSASPTSASAGADLTTSGVDLAATATAAAELLRPVLDPSMLVGQYTDAAARLAAGAVTDVALEVASGRAQHGVAIVRPPGHNATRDRAQGGCYFNSVAVAARAVQAKTSARRILVLDWDIHWGRGTQEIFAGDEQVLCLSLHRDESQFYPNVSSDAAPAPSINVAWSSDGVTDGDYMAAFMHVIMPVVYSFAPDLILVSAGFDAADRDFLGCCNVSPACYAHMTHLLKGVAPVVLATEGGYNLDQTAQSVEACVRVLLGERPPALENKLNTSGQGWVALMNAMQIHGDMWPALRPLSWNGYCEVIKEEQERASRGEEEQDDE